MLLSRSRFLAPATHSLRFYREYFESPAKRFHREGPPALAGAVRGDGIFINLDRVEQPDLGYFLEVKSRTWSRYDAEHKERLASDVIRFLGAEPQEMVTKDYMELVEGAEVR